MNIRKGFFRLTLVLSILFGIIALFFNEIFLPRSSINVEITEKWKNKSLQEKLKSIDDLLVNNPEFHKLSKIGQLNIRRLFKKSIPSIQEELKDGWEKYPIVINYPFYPEWRELGLLGFGGFALVWLIYLFIRWVIVGFIVGGFKVKS